MPKNVFKDRKVFGNFKLIIALKRFLIVNILKISIIRSKTIALKNSVKVLNSLILILICLKTNKTLRKLLKYFFNVKILERYYYNNY